MPAARWRHRPATADRCDSGAACALISRDRPRPCAGSATRPPTSPDGRRPVETTETPRGVSAARRGGCPRPMSERGFCVTSEGPYPDEPAPGSPPCAADEPLGSRSAVVLLRGFCSDLRFRLDLTGCLWCVSAANRLVNPLGRPADGGKAQAGACPMATGRVRRVGNSAHRYARSAPVDSACRRHPGQGENRSDSAGVSPAGRR